MPSELPESEIFVLLAERRRRLLLSTLEASSPPVAIGALADELAGREYEAPTTDDRRTVYLSLYHQHLPRLEEADVVTYDPEAGTVDLDVNFRPVVRVLRDVTERELPWSDQ